MSEPAAPYRFDADYAEDVSLRDGTRVSLRLLRPSDSALIEAAFARLSAHSRYLRFFVGKPRLTAKELNALTAVDNINHLALGAATRERGGSPVGLGVARFVRLAPSDHRAEAAVTVLDEVQGQGLGTILLTRLATAARERGIDVFVCDFLASNHKVRQWVMAHASTPIDTADGPVFRAEIPLTDSFSSPAGKTPTDPSVLYWLLGESARQGIRVHLRRLLLKADND